MRVAVVGGGLAGLAAALRLVDLGHEVTVLEARPTLGGAVQTLPEREGDPAPPPDNGQHIALGCFEAYLGFLARVGCAANVRRSPLALPVIGEDGRASTIRPGVRGLLGYRHLAPVDRLRVARTLARMRQADPATLDAETFADFLRRQGERDRSLERFWDVFVRPALNLRSAEASAALAVMTVQTALLGRPGASDLVLPAAPLGEMHGEAAARALAQAGAAVRTSSRVAALEDDAAVLADGERVAADALVIAVPPAESARLLGEEAPRFDDSPIVSVHLLFDRPLLRARFAALLGSPAHWVFDRGRLLGGPAQAGRYLTVVSSGAPELAALRGRSLVDVVAAAVAERLGWAELVWSRVSREPAATFAGRPGSAAERRGPLTARPNVVRAGAWTATGWPATMEGAVRSGLAAARSVEALVRAPVRA